MGWCELECAAASSFLLSSLDLSVLCAQPLPGRSCPAFPSREDFWRWGGGAGGTQELNAACTIKALGVLHRNKGELITKISLIKNKLPGDFFGI